MVEAVLEPFEGAPAAIRRRWSDDFKFAIAAESLLPGARPSRIAQRIGVATTQIFQWRKQAIRKGWISVPAAIPEVARATSGSSDRGVIEIILDGVIVRTHADSDQDHISRVIRAVRQV